MNRFGQEHMMGGQEKESPDKIEGEAEEIKEDDNDEDYEDIEDEDD